MTKTIIIADDSKTARMVTRRCLEIAGYSEADIQEAPDGEAALEIVRRQSIDLVVTDLNMPRMDGTSLLRAIKSSPRMNHVPVLVITSMSSQTREDELLKMGAFAVLSKPVNPAAVMEALEKMSEPLTLGEP